MPAAVGRRGWVRMKMFSDTDHASCVETRRSTTCGIIFLDETPFHGFARRQAVVSTSSGEAELYGGSTVIMEGKGIRELLRWYGYEVEFILFTDSSAAKSMYAREGLGRVKHLDIRALWVQQERVNSGLLVKKVGGAKNVADLGTKCHPRQRFADLRAAAGICDLEFLVSNATPQDAE